MAPRLGPHSRACIYVRQSQSNDDTISLELQERHCRALAQHQGYVVTRVFSDIDISGRKMDNRPGLLDLKTAYEGGEFDIALADDYSRFARNIEDGVHIIGSMPVGTYQEGIHQGDDHFMPMIHLLLAHKYSQDLSMRWRDAHRWRLERGLAPNGVKVFGYDRLNSAGQIVTARGQGAAMKYVPNGDADIVRSLYERYTNGVGSIPLVEELNTTGIPTIRGEQWQTAQLFRLLDNPFYSGRIVWAEAEWPGTHVPLLTDAQWLAYKAVREARRVKRRPPNPKWILAGLVRCPRCDGSMVSTMIRDRAVLTCSTSNNKGKAACPGMSRSRDWVLEGFFSWLQIHQDFFLESVSEGREARKKLETLSQEARHIKNQAQAQLAGLQRMALAMDWTMDQVRQNNEVLQAAFDRADSMQTETLAGLVAMGPDEISSAQILCKSLSWFVDDDGKLTLDEEAQFRTVLARRIDKIIPLLGPKGRFHGRRSADEIEVVLKKCVTSCPDGSTSSPSADPARGPARPLWPGPRLHPSMSGSNSAADT